MTSLVKKLSAFLITLVLILFGFVLVAHANQALAFTVSGHVSDSSAGDLDGATVDIIDTSTPFW